MVQDFEAGGDGELTLRKGQTVEVEHDPPPHDAGAAEEGETAERRNDLESYVLDMKSKIQEGGTYGPYITPADRDAFTQELVKAEDWLHDNSEGTKKFMLPENLLEIIQRGELVMLREQEAADREDWCEALRGTASNYRTAATSGDEKYAHIAPEKLKKIAAECDALETWLKDMLARQAGMLKTEDPILRCAEMERRNKALADVADEILSEPKPKPPAPPLPSFEAQSWMDVD